MTSSSFRRRGARSALGAAVLALAGCERHDGSTGEPPRAAEEAPTESLSREPLQPLPAAPSPDTRLVSLGRSLFFDPRLSSNGAVACVSCHDLANGGDDGRPRSRGVEGRIGRVNTPTVFNASLNFVLFWDGRAKTLEEQVDEPLTAPEAMGTTWPVVIDQVRRDATYAGAFRTLFDDGVTKQSIRAAIAAFERTLLTRDAPFDRWLGGEQGALTAAQEEGYELFKSVGCIACHQGRNVGGNMFQRFGVLGDYFSDRGNVTTADYGRFNVTGNEADRFVFRVPSLRNVELTAPYFHDGSAETLAKAVGVMAKYQLGRKLSDEQVSVLVAFLGSLTGVVPETVVGGRR